MISEDIPENQWMPGTDTVFSFDVVDGAGVPLNCTGFTMKFVVRSASNGLVVMEVSGAAIAVVAGLAAGSRVQVTTTPLNNTLTPGTFSGALWRTDVGSNHPLWEGNMPLTRVPAP